MTTTRRNHLTASHDRSPFIAERRRKLFPIDDHDMDSELGHISPLCSDTASDSDNEGVNSISDYDIIGIVENKRILGNETPVSIKACSETMSPLRLSPCTNSFIRKTPKTFSPSQNLKTPHDTSTKAVLQQQKALLEESKSLKRKSSPNSSPEQNKTLKIDFKNSKVRTALFPPENDIYTSMSTKLFYSKNQENILARISLNREKYIPKPIKYSTAKHSYKHKKKFGQINNGVGHKIRRPKLKKISKAVIAKATKKMLETGSALNDYIQDLTELKNKQNSDNKIITSIGEHIVITKSVQDPNLQGYLNDLKDLQTTKKLISTPVKHIQTITAENKENIQIKSPQRSVSPLCPSSPEGTKSRKFFKSSRSRIPSKPEIVQEKTKNFASKVDEEKANVKKFTLPNGESHKVINKVCLDSNNDFQDDDMEPEANIDNILSVLLDESPQKHVDDQNGTEETVQHVTSDISKSNCDILFSLNNVINSNGSEVAEHHESHFKNNLQYVSDTSGSYPDVVTTGCQDINSRQYVQIDSNTSTSEHCAYMTDHAAVNQPNFTENQECFNENLSSEQNLYESNTLQSHIVSSQVVFDKLLLEDANQPAVNGPSNQNGPLFTTSNSINPLKSTKIPGYSNKITLEAHKSILASENSIQLHQSTVANMILSPISQMCDVTSGLALNSPKKRRNLSVFLNNMSRASKILSFNNSHSADMEEQQKLFPVFYPGAKGAPERGEKRERGEVKRSAKKFKALHEDQMLLDAGQKKFGYTICNECKIVYHMGDPGDEIEHMNYHNASHILRFGGWKNEHVMADFQTNGRIIKVLPTDSKIWLKKVKDLMEFVKRDLGCYEMEYDISGSQVYLYIKNRTIAGCAVATIPKEGGHRMLSSVSGVAMCSEESYPIKCGVSHIWVAVNFRKQGIATALMDAVKSNFVYGYVLSNSDVALTSPTEAGSAFAEKYFKTQNYLVYYT